MGDMHKARLTLVTRANSRSPRPRVYGPDTQEEHKVKLTRAIAKNKQEATRISNAAKQAEADKLRGTSPVTRRRVAPTVSPGTRSRLLDTITEPDYRTNPYNAGSKPSKRRVRTVSFEERPTTITSEATKPVYPLTDPVEAARETSKAAADVYPDDGLKKGQNPIRSKHMDIDIVLQKKRSARIKERATPLLRSDDRRVLEEQWKPNDYETRAQKAAKKRIESARLKAAAAVDDATFPRTPPVPNSPWSTSKPPQVVFDIEAEKNRRVADAERDLRIKTHKRQVGQAVSRNRKNAPAVPRTGPQIKTRIAGGKITPGEAAWRSTFGAIEPFGGVMPNNPSTISRLAKKVGKAQGPVITNPSDLLTEYGKAGRAARLAKAQARSTSSAFLRSKSVAPFPGTAGRPNLPMSY